MRPRLKFLFTVFILLIINDIKSQEVLSFGIKFNPSSTLVYKTASSEIDKRYFDVINFKIRPQLGIVASFQLKKYIFDYSLFFGSKKVGLTFNRFAVPFEENTTEVYYKTTVIFNKISLGYLLNKNQKFKIYFVLNFGIDLNSVTGESGSGTIMSPKLISYTEYLPIYPTAYQSVSSGLSLKFRTTVKVLGLIDFGVTYDHL